MADVQGREATVTQRGEQVAALVRAISRAHQSPSGYGGVERFSVSDIHEFARRLVADVIRRRVGWVLLGLGAAGCAGQSSKPGPALSTAGADYSRGDLQAGSDSIQPLRVHVAAPRRAVVGTAVPIKLVVSNSGRTKVQVLQAVPPPAFDLTITRKDGRVVWQRLPPDAVLATAGLLYSLAAGQSHDVETISWDQRDLHGRQVEPGRYEIQGTFYGRVAYSGHSEIQSDTVSLLIER